MSIAEKENGPLLDNVERGYYKNSSFFERLFYSRENTV